METLKQRALRGRAKENLIHPIALANLVLHGIDKPNLWHGTTLSGMEIYGWLFEGAVAADIAECKELNERLRERLNAVEAKFEELDDLILGLDGTAPGGR